MRYGKTRPAKMGNLQFEVLALLSRRRPGHFQALELRLERVAKQMIQGVHPWIKVRKHPAGDGSVMYSITADGRAKVQLAAKDRGVRL